MTALRLLSNARRQFEQEVLVGIVFQGMHCIETQAVKTIIPHPHQSVLDQELAHKSAALVVKIERRTPARVMTLRKEAFGVCMQVIQVWPKMIVDHVEVDHYVERMSRSYQPLEIFRSSIMSIRRVQEHPVVA